MYKLEKIVHKTIESIIPRNFLQGENEKGYWNRHWENKIDYYNKHGTPFEIRNKWWENLYDEMYSYYKKEVSGFKNKEICELGAGSGYTTLLMAKEGANVTLVDFAPKSVNYAKKIMNYLDIPQNRVSFIEGNIFSRDLTDKKFDVVWNCGVVEHYKWKKAKKLVKNMSFYTKEEGKVLITLPNLLSPFLIYKMLKEGKGSEIFFSHRLLKKLMIESGLINVSISPINYWVPSFLPHSWANSMRNSSIGKKIKFLPWLFNGTGEKVTS